MRIQILTCKSEYMPRRLRRKKLFKTKKLSLLSLRSSRSCFAIKTRIYPQHPVQYQTDLVLFLTFKATKRQPIGATLIHSLPFSPVVLSSVSYLQYLTFIGYFTSDIQYMSGKTIQPLIPCPGSLRSTFQPQLIFRESLQPRKVLQNLQSESKYKFKEFPIFG